MSRPLLRYADAVHALWSHHPVAPDEVPEVYLVMHEVGPVTLLVLSQRAADVLYPLISIDPATYGPCRTGPDCRLPRICTENTWLGPKAQIMFDRLADAAGAADLDMVIEYARAGRDPRGIDYTSLRRLPEV